MLILCDPEQQLTGGKDVQSGFVTVPEPYIKERNRKVSQNRSWWVSGAKALITYKQRLTNRRNGDRATMARSLELPFSADLPWVHRVLVLFNEMTDVKGPVQHRRQSKY